MTAATYPIRFTAQLRQHLQALRKKHNLTQAELGALVGVSQVRIAEIEANPGVVNFEQLQQLLSVLDVTLVLQENPSSSLAPMKAEPVFQVEKSKPAKKSVLFPAISSEKAKVKEISGQPTAVRKFIASVKKGAW